MKALTLLLTPLALLFFSACSSSGGGEFVPPPPSTPEPVRPDFMSGSGSGRGSFTSPGFRLKSGDRVGILAFRGISGAVLASGTYTVNSSGRVTLPTVGEVGISGLTPKQATQTIEASYRRHIGGAGNLGQRAFISSINGSSIVLVDGRVARPGAVSFRSGMTLGDALKGAGGQLDQATSTSTLTLRRKAENRILSVNSAGLGTKLQPGDFIILPRVGI